jgi:integrase
MSSSLVEIAEHPKVEWRMPIVPEAYDRSPLTDEELWALHVCVIQCSHNPGLRETVAARRLLVRLDAPIADVFHLRYKGKCLDALVAVQRIVRREMYRLGKIFWQWSEQDWLDILCPTVHMFYARHGKNACTHMPIMDAAYLIGSVADLRPVGMEQHTSEAASTYFGAELVDAQCKRIFDALAGKGYKNGRGSVRDMRKGLSTLFLLNRSPYLEDISGELLAVASAESVKMRQVTRRITTSLQSLDLLPTRTKDASPPLHFSNDGMAKEWYAWCMAWYKQNVDLSPAFSKKIAHFILAVGRWLQAHVPDVCTPEQWTEDLALEFRADLCTWTVGQYAVGKAQVVLDTKGKLGKPLGKVTIGSYLTAIRRYFLDLTKRPHRVDGEPGRRIRLDFDPRDAFSTPDPIKRAADVASPRDIDLQVWAKLTIAAATFSTQDLRSTRYPLSFYRALALIWVTSARRPDEIIRLRLDCLREEWAPDMLDEDGYPVEHVILNDAQSEPTSEGKGLKLNYLQIPAGKNRGPFWIWIPDYVASEIEVWRRERPAQQSTLLDKKDRENVEYLFCSREMRVGKVFINTSLIPALCRKAGVDMKDAKGRITGHRGRSTRLTLLRRRGVSLEDLAEYAGHANTQTIRRYAREDPFQLHRIIRDADDTNRIIEGVLDLQAAAKGKPAVRWLIGYDADGNPMLCGNQCYITCAHRLDCKHCGMFIGGEKARLLYEGDQVLPIQSKVPMTPIEQCVVNGDQEGAQRCREALQQAPVPEAPDIALIFNPEGLSNHELEKLAQLATADAMDLLRQALAAHEQRLAEAKSQHKTGRNALIGGLKKRIGYIRELIDEGKPRNLPRQERQG